MLLTWAIAVTAAAESTSRQVVKGLREVAASSELTTLRG